MLHILGNLSLSLVAANLKANIPKVQFRLKQEKQKRINVICDV